MHDSSSFSASSILFVIVAQDITLSEFTPVTQEFLWIYKLSLGSKIFVIGGIIQSIVTLYVFNHDDDEPEDQHTANENNKNINNDESRPFLDNASGRRGSRSVSTLADIEENGSDCVEMDQETQDAAHNFSEVCNASFEGSNADHPDHPAPESATPQEDTPSSTGSRRGCCWRWSPRREMREPKALMKSTFVNIVGEDIIPKKNDCEKTRKMKSLLMIDKITAMLFFSGYGIFLLIMFVHRH